VREAYHSLVRMGEWRERDGYARENKKRLS
jgi:hypothetical protein